MRPTSPEPCNSRQSSLLCDNWAPIEVHSVPAWVRMKRCGNDSWELLQQWWYKNLGCKMLYHLLCCQSGKVRNWKTQKFRWHLNDVMRAEMWHRVHGRCQGVTGTQSIITQFPITWKLKHFPQAQGSLSCNLVLVKNKASHISYEQTFCIPSYH